MARVAAAVSMLVIAAAPAAVGAQEQNPERVRQERIAGAEADAQGGPVVDPDEARRIARDNVDLPEPQEPPDLPEIDVGTPTGPGIFGNVVFLVVVGLIVGAIVLVVIAVARRRGKTDDIDDDEPDTPESAVIGEIADTDVERDWRRLASEAATRGAYADAIRYLHLAGVIRLDADGHIDFDASRTNGDYVHALTSLDDTAAARLRRLSHTMEATTFGYEAADRAVYDASDRQWDELHSHLAGVGRDRGRPSDPGGFQ